MAACATGPYALVLVPALMYASYKASDYVEEKQNQLESWINSFCDTDGAINTGSENVKINGELAARAAVTLPPPPPPEQYLKSHRGNPHGVILPLTCLNRQRKKQYHWRRPGERCYHPDGQQCRFYGSRQRRRIASVSRRSGINGVCHHGGRAWRNQKEVDFPEAGEDTALCDKENKPPRIARGSSNVFINNQPAARKGDKLECSAAIVGGSPDVFIGGEQVTYLDIQPEFPPWQRMIPGE